MKAPLNSVFNSTTVGAGPHRLDSLADLQKITVIRRFPHHVVIKMPFPYFHEEAEAAIDLWLDEHGQDRFNDYVQSRIIYGDDMVETAFAFKNKKTAALFKLTWG